LRQPGGFFRHYLAVVNLDFQREIAHAENIAQWRPVANQMRPTPIWARAPVQTQGGQKSNEKQRIPKTSWFPSAIAGPARPFPGRPCAILAHQGFPAAAKSQLSFSR
jgi:hypothetical protein